MLSDCDGIPEWFRAEISTFPNRTCWLGCL